MRKKNPRLTSIDCDGWRPASLLERFSKTSKSLFFAAFFTQTTENEQTKNGTRKHERKKIMMSLRHMHTIRNEIAKRKATAGAKFRTVIAVDESPPGCRLPILRKCAEWPIECSSQSRSIDL